MSEIPDTTVVVARRLRVEGLIAANRILSDDEYAVVIAKIAIAAHNEELKRQGKITVDEENLEALLALHMSVIKGVGQCDSTATDEGWRRSLGLPIEVIYA